MFSVSNLDVLPFLPPEVRVTNQAMWIAVDWGTSNLRAWGIGADGAVAFSRSSAQGMSKLTPDAYAGAPLAGPHAKIIENSTIAARSNGNSCTTCHTPTQPVENACIQCHQAEQFHASNTKAHEEAGVTCVSCHKEHLGADFDMKASAIQSCAECHNDANKRTFNGKTVRTAHNGSYGYPVENGEWKWQGVYREVAAAIPEITGSATADANEQGTRNRQLHSVHVARLLAPNSTGRVATENRTATPKTNAPRVMNPVDWKMKPRKISP